MRTTQLSVELKPFPSPAYLEAGSQLLIQREQDAAQHPASWAEEIEQANAEGHIPVGEDVPMVHESLPEPLFTSPQQSHPTLLMSRTRLRGLGLLYAEVCPSLTGLPT